MQKRRALIVGATGLVGRECLQALLANDHYTKVTVLSRNPIEGVSPTHRLNTIIAPLEEAEKALHDLEFDDIYCCLGTTMAKAKTQQAFRLVDFDFPARIAKIGERSQAQHYLLVSAVGADAESKMFYSRTKGEIENYISDCHYKHVSIFQPSFLMGNRQENRLGERLGIIFAQLLSFFLVGKLRRYRPIPADYVAIAMVQCAIKTAKQQSFKQSSHLKQFSDSKIYWYDAMLDLVYSQKAAKH